jgi:elongation factor P
MIKAVDLRRSMAIYHEGEVFIVHESHHVAKGNKRSYMQTKLKNAKSGQLADVRFRVDDTVEQPFMQKQEMEFLYRDGEDLVLMDLTTFEQINVPQDLIGDALVFLKPNEQIELVKSDEQIIGVSIPNVVELEVVDTPPQVKGATATNQLKDAVLETGARIRVPPFIEVGESVRIDTRSGEYVERAK